MIQVAESRVRQGGYLRTSTSQAALTFKSKSLGLLKIILGRLSTPDHLNVKQVAECVNKKRDLTS